MQSPGQIINTLQPGQFARISKVLPSGSLEARKLASGGTMLYWRFTADAKTLREPIGVYDSAASPKSLQPTQRGFSVQAAIRAAEVMAQLHYQHRDEGGHTALKEAQKVNRAKELARAAAEYQHTLQHLLLDYCDHLEKLGRRSHKDARSIFRRHVFDPWPKLAALPAHQVTMEQVADMMRMTLESGKGRTANKLRSYLRAAFQVAKASRSKASIPAKFKDYNITTNPAAETFPDESSNKPDKNPLTPDEMRVYWQCIKDMTGFKGAALRLHLLSGGQRIEQLVTLQTSNIDGNTITLYDGKGRPGQDPRPHKIPLTPKALAALTECNPQGKYALSTDGGVTHLGAITLSKWANEAVGKSITEFQTKRVRSGVETILAVEGISSELRGRLQSHGITGVQARHYDGHEYLGEKLKALRTLYTALQPIKTAKRGLSRKPQD